MVVKSLNITTYKGFIIYVHICTCGLNLSIFLNFKVSSKLQTLVCMCLIKSLEPVRDFFNIASSFVYDILFSDQSYKLDSKSRSVIGQTTSCQPARYKRVKKKLRIIGLF
jgi:hypothetical protein